jgi:hypothetical protein
VSHSSPIAAALGLPPNASKHPDPDVRRAYWAEVKRRDVARKLAAAQAGSARCVKRIGYGKCGGVLEVAIDRIGRTRIVCPKCARRLAGLCATCPNPIDGDPKRGASWCAPCRRRHTRKRKNLRERLNPEQHAARTRRKRRELLARMHRALESADPAERAAAEAWFAHRTAAQRAAYDRMAAKRRAAGLPVSSKAYNRELARRERLAQSRKAA